MHKVMPPVKQCPQCGSMVAIKKSICVCGHSFKRKPPVYATRKSKRVAKQLKRALESADETSLRKQLDRAYQSRKRTSETSAEILCRQEHDRAYKAQKRASETVVETAQRREQNHNSTK